MRRRISLLLCSLFVTYSSLLAQQPKSDPEVLFPIEVNGRWGYIDIAGKVIVPPKFEAGLEFSEGLAVVEIEDKWGYINAKGEMVIAPIYSMARRFSEGLARVQVDGDAYGYYGKWGFIDKTGRMVIEPQFASLQSASDSDYEFHDGMAMIERDFFKGFIDKTGNVVIRPRFALAYSFSDGLASVREESTGKWGYIDKTGTWAIPAQFDWASMFSEGLGPVSRNGVCGYIDRTGAMKLAPKFKTGKDDCATVWGSFNDGLSRWSIDNKYAFINKQGEVVIKPQFDLTFNFSEGLAFVQVGEKYGYIDSTGRMVIAPQFYNAKDFQNGLAFVSDGAEGWGYVDKSGKFVWKETVTTTDAVASNFIQPGHTSDVLFVGWSPDGRLLASYSAGDEWIKVWNAVKGQLIWDIKATLLKPDQPQKSPDGKLLASGVTDETYEIRDAQSGNVIWTIKAHATSDERVASPDGSMIAQRDSYADNAVKLLDAKTNQLIRRLEGHPGIILATAFSPDGKMIATGSADCVIRFWDAKQGALLKTLTGHLKPVSSLAFTSVGTLVSASKDDTLKVWSVADGQLLRSIKLHSGDGFSSMSVSRDGRTVFGSSDTEVKVWDLASEKQLHVLATNESHTSPGPHGMQMTWCCGSEVRSVAFSPDEALIASAHGDGTIKFWDARSARLMRIIKSRSSDLKVVTFSPDGKLIATGYYGERRVDLWSVRTGKRVRSLGEDSDYATSLSFSNDGRMVAIGHAFNDLSVWDTKTGQRLRKFDQSASEYDRVAFSPDGKFFVSGGENQNLLLWNAETGSLVWSLLPIDWATEKRVRQEAQKRNAIRTATEAEQKRKTVAADKLTATWVRPVAITFDHYGEAINPLAQRLGETGQLNVSLIRRPAAEADGIWFRLRNNSPLPISFHTDSMYFPRPGCGVKLSDGSIHAGLCDGAEVSIQYEVQEANGKAVPFGIDISSSSILPPGAAVLFSVDKSHLSAGRKIFVRFTYLKENETRELEEFGSTHRVQFHSSRLRRYR